MFKRKLNQVTKLKNSLLCVGLDSDLTRIPAVLLKEKDPLVLFNREIIQATAPFVSAFKINIAFYESLGIPGWQLLENTLKLIPENVLLIADAKRGDIGNSARKYADTFFTYYPFDAVTVSPYMGEDSVTPFLDFSEKGVFILCLTSNPGAQDFQYLPIESTPLFLHVAKKILEWDLEYGNCGLVAGATHPEDLDSVRKLVPDLPFLIPGVGAQGGNLSLAVQTGTDRNAGNTLINSSRGILYGSSEANFAEEAARAARELNEQINAVRDQKLST